MSFFTRQEEVGSSGAGMLGAHEKVVPEQKPRRASAKWPLRWVTLTVLFICTLFWIAFFTLIF
jgi:hypothetical protein